MRLKYCMLSVFTLFSLAAGAQDKIYKTNGEVIDAKVMSVGKANIVYKRFDNPDGPDYFIPRKQVDQVKYQNGTTDNLYASNRGKQYKKEFGNNLLSIIPGSYTVALDGSINDPGVGICYERLLDERGHIGFSLPLIINFSSQKDFNNNFYSYNNYPLYTSNKQYTSVCFMPGIKFYPGNSNKHVRYAIGGSFFVLSGKEPYYVYDNSTTGNYYGDYHYTTYGFMVTNSVNITVIDHLYMSLDLNNGIPISDNRRLASDAVDNIFSPWVQFMLKVGYRF